MAAKALKAPQILDLIMAEASGGGRGMFSRGGSTRQVGLSDSGSRYITPLGQLKPVKTERIYHLTVVADGGSNRGPRPFHSAIQELIVRLSYAGIFIKFIFVGDDEEGREFPELLDDLPVAKHPNDLADPSDPSDPRRDHVDYYEGTRYIDNVSKVEFPRGLALVSDEDFAGAMTEELPTYVPSAVRRSLVTTDHLVMV